MDKQDIELLLLRDFYKAWCLYNSISRDKPGRPPASFSQEKEVMKQEIASISDSIEKFYSDKKKIEDDKMKELQAFHKGFGT